MTEKLDGNWKSFGRLTREIIKEIRPENAPRTKSENKVRESTSILDFSGFI